MFHTKMYESEAGHMIKMIETYWSDIRNIIYQSLSNRFRELCTTFVLKRYRRNGGLYCWAVLRRDYFGSKLNMQQFK